MIVDWVHTIEGFYTHTYSVDEILRASFGKVSFLTLPTSGQNFVIFVPSERHPSLPGSNTGSFERLPHVPNALKFGFS